MKKSFQIPRLDAADYRIADDRAPSRDATANSSCSIRRDLSRRRSTGSLFYRRFLCAIVVIPVLAITAFIYGATGINRATRRLINRIGMTAKCWRFSGGGFRLSSLASWAIIRPRDTYALASAEAAVTDVKPIEIQVTSLDWKWLFQYPDKISPRSIMFIFPQAFRCISN